MIGMFSYFSWIVFHLISFCVPILFGSSMLCVFLVICYGFFCWQLSTICIVGGCYLSLFSSMICVCGIIVCVVISGCFGHGCSSGCFLFWFTSMLNSFCFSCFSSCTSLARFSHSIGDQSGCCYMSSCCSSVVNVAFNCYWSSCLSCSLSFSCCSHSSFSSIVNRSSATLIYSTSCISIFSLVILICWFSSLCSFSSCCISCWLFFWLYL